MMNKKGSLIYALFFLISISAFAIFLLIMGYIGKTVGDEMIVKFNDSAHSESVNKSFQATIDVSTTTLGTLWYIMFGCLLIGVFISAWFTKAYPIMLPVFVILLICSIIVGVAMSNAYEALGDATQLSTAAAQQGAVGFMMTKLPYIALVVGLFAIIIMLAKPGGGTPIM